MHSVSSRGDAVLNDHAKELLYKIHCNRGEFAIDSNGARHPLRNFDITRVKHVAGMWRVQNDFNEPIQVVRGREFVLGERIPRTERNMFEFYYAYMVGRNCYGRFLIKGPKCVVAKYETDNETHWAYGDTIEQARAFLGISLYDKYMDLIHSVACRKKLSRGGK